LCDDATRRLADVVPALAECGRDRVGLAATLTLSRFDFIRMWYNARERSIRQRQRLITVGRVEPAQINRLSFAAPVSGAVQEHARDRRAAVATPIAAQCILPQVVPIPFDQHFLAVRTVRTLPFEVIDIAAVDVFEARLQGDLASVDQ